MEDIILILLLGIGLNWVSPRVSIPAAAMQVLLGVVIGPGLLGWVLPDDRMRLLGEVGVVLLLGTAGLHLGLGPLARAGWAGLWVAVLGILFSFAGGYGFALWWTIPHPEAIYIGTALAATSIGISVEVLRQCGLLESRIGQVVVAAAVVDDILALYLLALAHGVLSGDFALWRVALSALLAFFVVAAVFWVARALGRLSATHRRSNAGVTRIGGAVELLLAFAWVTDRVGLSLVVGGFFAGLGLGEGLGERARQDLARGIESFVLVLAPFFFVLIGARAQLSFLTEPAMGVLLFGLLVVAIVCKILGGLLGAARTGMWPARVLIGVSMVPRGEVSLIIASLGFEQTHLSHHVFVTLVLMIIATSVLAPFAMVPLARKHTQMIEAE